MRDRLYGVNSIVDIAKINYAIKRKINFATFIIICSLDRVNNNKTAAVVSKASRYKYMIM